MTWMLELYKEMGRPTVEVVQELLNENSMQASAGIIGISPHTLKKYALEKSLTWVRNRNPVERKIYKSKRQCIRSRILELDGKREPLEYWAKNLGVGHSVIIKRLANGWSTKDALTKPPCPNRFQKGNNGGFSRG